MRVLGITVHTISLVLVQAEQSFKNQDVSLV